MHAAFIPYGHARHVRYFLRDIEAQKYKFPVKNPVTGAIKEEIVEGQLRVLPFGVYEHVFPKEYMDVVLTTLRGFKKDNYALGKMKMKFLQKFLKLKPAPEFKTDQKFFWYDQHVAIIFLGIREDPDVTVATHEGI